MPARAGRACHHCAWRLGEASMTFPQYKWSLKRLRAFLSQRPQDPEPVCIFFPHTHKTSSLQIHEQPWLSGQLVANSSVTLGYPDCMGTPKPQPSPRLLAKQLRIIPCTSAVHCVLLLLDFWSLVCCDDHFIHVLRTAWNEQKEPGRRGVGYSFIF